MLKSGECYCIAMKYFKVFLLLLSSNLWGLESINDPSLKSYLDCFPKQDYVIYKVDGLGNFYVDDIPDGIKWHLKQGIYWESGIGRYVSKYTRQGTVAIDLGAHIGIHTLTMSRCVGKNGHVIAFEPQYKIYRELYHNLKLNHALHNVTLYRNAVGDQEKWIEMMAADPLNEGGTPVGYGGDRALMVTLDSLNLSNVSFIKMDIESSELFALYGAYETFVRNQPVIVFEVLGGVDLDDCPPEKQIIVDKIMEYFATLNYNVERIFGNDFIATPSKQQ